jgi:hypothetical protein
MELRHVAMMERAHRRRTVEIPLDFRESSFQSALGSSA